MSTLPHATMPFGKFKGQRLSDLPAEYLAWVLTLDLREPLRTAAHREADRRRADTWADDPAARRRPCPAPDVAEALIAAGRRALAQKHHPDIGGTPAVMTDINNVTDWLRPVVRRGLAA